MMNQMVAETGPCRSVSHRGNRSHIWKPHYIQEKKWKRSLWMCYGHGSKSCLRWTMQGTEFKLIVFVVSLRPSFFFIKHSLALIWWGSKSDLASSLSLPFLPYPSCGSFSCSASTKLNLLMLCFLQVHSLGLVEARAFVLEEYVSFCVWINICLQLRPSLDIFPLPCSLSWSPKGFRSERQATVGTFVWYLFLSVSKSRGNVAIWNVEFSDHTTQLRVSKDSIGWDYKGAIAENKDFLLRKIKSQMPSLMTSDPSCPRPNYTSRQPKSKWRTWKYSLDKGETTACLSN